MENLAIIGYVILVIVVLFGALWGLGMLLVSAISWEPADLNDLDDWNEDE